MKKEQKQKEKPRNSYSSEFKIQAIELAKEIGPKKAADKLGIKSLQTISAWIRYSKKMDEDTDFKELEEAKKEIKRLKKELESEQKAVAILRDATVFFCQDHLK